MRPAARGDPALHLLRRPGPRPRAGELREPAHQSAPAARSSTRSAGGTAADARHPDSIDSNNAGSARNGVTPSTSTSAADPATLRCCGNGHLHGTRIRCNETGIQRNRIRCHIMAAAATKGVQGQFRPRGLQPAAPSPARPSLTSKTRSTTFTQTAE